MTKPKPLVIRQHFQRTSTRPVINCHSSPPHVTIDEIDRQSCDNPPSRTTRIANSAPSHPYHFGHGTCDKMAQAAAVFAETDKRTSRAHSQDWLDSSRQIVPQPDHARGEVVWPEATPRLHGIASYPVRPTAFHRTRFRILHVTRPVPHQAILEDPENRHGPTRG